MPYDTPPPHLAYSLPLTAIEEEMRMDALGIRFLCHSRCFHYLIPIEPSSGEEINTEAGQGHYYLFSYLYHPITKLITRCQKTPIEDERIWESRACDIGAMLIQQDRDQDLWE